MTISPENPRTRTRFVVATDINSDPTLGGAIPDATSWTPTFDTHVYMGPNPDRCKAVFYVRKNEKPLEGPVYITGLACYHVPTELHCVCRVIIVRDLVVWQGVSHEGNSP